jgi:hypothetical protein
MPLLTRHHLPVLLLAAGWPCLQLAAEEAPPAPPQGALPGFGEAPSDEELEKLLAEPPMLAEDLLPPEQPDAGALPSETAVVNLIRILVGKGVLTKAEAEGMMLQAEQEAAMARQASAAAALIAADASMATDEDVVVTHVPDPVRQRLQEEIKADLLREAKEGAFQFNAPGSEKFTFSGDVRARFSGQYFPENANDNTGAFPDFNAINTGEPFDVAGSDFSPQLNVDEDRTSMQLRARMGFEALLEDGWSLGVRAATGNDASPVSPNQRLGGGGGNFSKYSLWLDRGYIRYEILPDAAAPASGDKAPLPWQPDYGVTFQAGRFDNPFYRTSNMVWDDDLGFDGLSLQARREIAPGVMPFINAGMFPIFNTALNFSTNNPDKFESTDRWLYGAQGGIGFKPAKDVSAKFGVGYFDFDNIEGERSTPYLPLSTKDGSDTDSRRPGYAQRGNTYMALRDIIPDPLNDFGTSKQWQYFGLASQFRVLNYTGRLDLDHFEPVRIGLFGEYAVNLAHDPMDIETKAVNNRGPVAEGESFGNYAGGDTAWNVGIQFGEPKPSEKWDWNVEFGYRYVESDALVDALVDSNFFGGTNTEGFILGGALAVSPDVVFRLRWMSGNEIAGPPRKSDLLLIDLNASF